jgi:CheY-like chemotaxis protein
MAGEIGVMSELDKGSTFVFYIKTRRAAKQAASTPLISPLPLRQVANGIAASVPPSSAPRLHTLLVEDNIVNQKVLTGLLMRHNIAVTVANHGLEALETIRTCDTAFDVTLMDMQMPVMDGLTCIKEIRRLEHEGLLKGRMPIIAVTANARHAQIESAIDAGADRVVQKPYKAKELVDLMRVITGSKGNEGARAG